MKSKKAFLFRKVSLLTIIICLSLTFSLSHQTPVNSAVEIPEKRTLNSQTFDNGDGTFTLKAHVGHIHYVDKTTGKLEECDTTLIDVGDKWIQTKASYHCEIPKYADSDFVFIDVFEDNNQSLTMKPVAQRVVGKFDNSDGWVNKRVIYRNAYGKGIHLRVTAGNMGLFKEVIIDEMPNPLKDLTFDFEVSLPTEEHVYIADLGSQPNMRKVDLADLTIAGDNEVLIGQGAMGENAFTHIRKIRVWDKGGNAMNGRARFYREGSTLYFRKIVPKEFLSSATYPVYTDDTLSPLYSGPGDGYVAGWGATWDQAHDKTTGDVANYTSTAVTGLAIASGINASGQPAIYRGFLPVDATALPDDAGILSASLFFAIYDKGNGDNDGYDYIAVVGETTQASPTSLTTADYDTCGSVNNPATGSPAYDITNIATGQYLEMELSATAFSWIRKSGTGDNAYSRFGIREGHDRSDHAYAGATDSYNFVRGPASEYGTGTAYDPYLSVTYGHEVTTPSPPWTNWDGYLYTNVAYEFRSTISTCNKGHNVEYQFDWDDGTYSDWGPWPMCHAWTDPGTYYISARARCEEDITVTSGWSDTREVIIYEACVPPTVPDMPTGGTSGETEASYVYTTGGSSPCSQGHEIYYQFSWGDTSYSRWIASSSPVASHSWIEPGTYEIKARAGCKGEEGGNVRYISDWSPILTVNISQATSTGPNLEVPIEMVDYGLGSSQSVTTTFARSAVGLNPDDYDGATYYFEIVAANFHTSNDYDVTLMEVTSEPDVEMKTITVPAGTDVPTRMGRVSSFEPTQGGYKQYKVRLEGTDSDLQLRVYTARIIVVQRHATRTRIQIPLVQEQYNTGSKDPQTTDATMSTAYTQGDADKFTIWAKDNAAWGSIAPGNAWTFEALLGSSGGTAYASLFTTGIVQVTDSEVSNSGTSDLYVKADFANDAVGFDDGEEFFVGHRISDGSFMSYLVRACLYVKLTNLSRGEIYWRFSRGIFSQGAALTHDYQRVLLNTDGYSNPTLYYESTGRVSSVGTVRTELARHAAFDSGTDGAIDVADTDFSSTTSARMRSSFVIHTQAHDRYRYIYEASNILPPVQLETASAWLVVKFFSESPCTYTVCKDGSCDYTEISYALWDAKDKYGGGKIVVNDSEVYGPISTLGGAHIAAGDGCTPTLTHDRDTVSLMGGNVTLEGLTIRNTASYIGQPPIYVGDVKNAIIKNCTITARNFGAPHIRLASPRRVTITGCTLRNCDRAGISTGSRIWGGETGASGGTHVVIKGCTVSDNDNSGITIEAREPGVTAVIDGGNVISNNDRGGINCEDVSSLIINGNTIFNNTRAGIRLAGVGSADEPATIMNNTIYGHTIRAGINVEQGSYAIIGDNNEIYSNQAGVSIPERCSGEVSIQNNHIYSNTQGGVALLGRITGPLNITGNEIESNDWGGIYIDLSELTNPCESPEPAPIEIMDNDVHDNGYGGIHTTGGAGPTVTIRGNKVYRNGSGGMQGGGIDVRHASATIENNLVYRNYLGGIRVGDNTTAVINNTVVFGGYNNTKGGGIIYTDQIDDVVTDPPSGAPLNPFPIKNNIIAGSYKAGIRACFYTTELYRNYNLLYWNNQDLLSDWCGDCASPDCSTGDRRDKRRCRGAQLGAGCNGETPFCCSAIGATGALPGETLIFAAPLFENVGADDYRLAPGSPAIGAGELGVDLGCYGGDYPIDW